VDKIQVLQYVIGSSLFTLILGYVVGRVVSRAKLGRMRLHRDLHLRARIIAEEKAEKIEGKYIVLKCLAKGSDGIG
jgi:hypothetical protein